MASKTCASCNSARHALADLTGTSISNVTRWTAYAKRDWFDWIACRKELQG
ncbi:hypothetical protein [Streptomyces sp. NPDC047841]|uniref:hypothetical protein n=1 Tax=Streptomyces sp. NPDC047841 TaxID=3154708 RepID=UPI0034549824